MRKDYEPLHHKYRPQCFDDLVGQESIALTLKQAIQTNRIAPAYLFSGPRGTGKTSSARILARSLNCIQNNFPTIDPCGTCELCQTIALGSALDVIEIDAASNTGVDNIRELIEKSQFSPVKARWKIYVIDECHMLSTAAFNALLKTLEEPPKKVVFVLATTDPQRVLPTIVSRCQRFDFRRIPLTDLTNHLSMIAKKENIAIEAAAIEIISKHAQGGLRDAESMLDQLSLLPQPIKQNSVWDLLGVVPENEILDLVEAFTRSDPISILQICRNLLDLGREPISILQGFASILRDLVVKNAAPNQPELCSISQESHEKLERIAVNTNIENIFRWQSQLKGSENQLRQSLQPSLWLEVLLLGLLNNPNIKENSKIDKNQSENIQTNLTKKSLTSNTEKLIKSETNNKKFDTLIESKTNREKETNESNENLSELWKQILASLELPSTRMLLSQQATLIKLSENIAEINVASNWISMIQQRKILIEEAINKTLGSPRKLILNADSKTNIDKNITVKKAEESPVEVKQEKDFLNPNSGLNSSKVEKEEEINNLNLRKNPSQKNENIEKLADFFNGEIVELE